MRFSDWTNKWNRYFLFFSTLAQQILPICSRYNKNTVWSFLENVSNFFSLIESEISEWATISPSGWLTFFINFSYFATESQNTLHKQRKKERINRNNPWPQILAIPNSPVQFCPFPVYPGWQ